MLNLEAIKTGVYAALLTTEEMSRADAQTIASGTPGIVLMERAGLCVAEAALRHWPGARRILVMCGPGNNGGDGYVAARRLVLAGRSVVLAAGHEPTSGTDAALAAELWEDPVVPFAEVDPAGFDLVIDALFGAGLSRPLDGPYAGIVDAVNQSGVPVLAVDVPSGIDGNTGLVKGLAATAAVTVTFFRMKPGHCLLPGREHAGVVEVADIGIPARVLEDIEPRSFRNDPALWSALLRPPAASDHKYRRGHVGVFSGGPAATGAARLAAAAAARCGAGLVSVLTRPSAQAVNAGHLTGIMVKRLDPEADLGALLGRLKISAAVIGPGLGTGDEEWTMIDGALEWAAATGNPLVIDADAITLMGQRGRNTLPDGINAAFLPHDGEFRRLFPDFADADRLTRARRAATQSGGVVVLKGADTVIAAPDGRAIINGNAPPYLARAGSGDVLAGAVAAMAGQGMPLFEAATAAAFLHGSAGRIAGPSLIADDLPRALGRAFAETLKPA